MAKRYRQKAEEPESVSFDTPLPTHLPVANYYRQSTMAQVGNISTDIQTIDMVAYLIRLGWDEDRVIMIDMDAGVSGTTKIDERPGMSQLFRLITTDKVGAISCQDEDRLFRDVTQIQVNIFIEACRQHNVLVITPSMIYNFRHEQMGVFYARQFRYKSEMAADYITSYVKGKLHRARRRVLMNGRWAGAPMPPGYMVDMRKELPNGALNSDWRKLVIFPQYAEVARAYWSLFQRYDGQIRPTLRHIHKYGPYYPDPNVCKPPDGFKVVYRMRPFKGKWCPASRAALVGMFTNATYAGHWMVNGTIVIWDNHPAIIEQDVFMRAFHYLSAVGLDGSPNQNYSPVHLYAQPSKRKERPEEWPLCAGLLMSQDTDETWLRVHTRWSKANGHYAYECWSSLGDYSIWWKKASFVDQAVTQVLVDKLQATFDFDTWERTIEQLAELLEEERSLKQSQLKQLRVVMDNLLAGLGTLQHPHLIKAAEQQYTDAEAEMQRLERELAQQDMETPSVEQIKSLRNSCADIFQNWPHMSREEQREVLHTFVERIEATQAEGNGLALFIRWNDGSTSVTTVANQAGPYLAWTDEEQQHLIALMESDALQVEIAKAFPNRTWEALCQRYYGATNPDNKVKRRRKRLIKGNETYLEYLERMGTQSLADSTLETGSEKGSRGVPRISHPAAASVPRQPDLHD